ncbi:MAG: membrane protein insertase YidC [Bacteroidales bacterium]|nr:membrane protein insertase YidC [Candidatus Cacconaster equifaecalis]
MSSEKSSSVIGFVLIGVILLLFSWYNTKQYEKQVESNRKFQDSLAMVEAAEAFEAIDETSGTDSLQTDPAPLYQNALINEASGSAEEFVTIENGKLALTVSTRGAQPYSVLIKDYFCYDSTALYLLRPGKSSFDLELNADQWLNTSDLNFKVAYSTDSSLGMRLHFSDTSYIEAVYVIQEDSYLVDYKLNFIGMDKVLDPRTNRIEMDWSVDLPRLEKGYTNEKNYSAVAYRYASNTDVKTIGQRKDAVKETFSSNLRWFGFQQQFFSAIMVAPQDFTGGTLTNKFYEEGNPERNLMRSEADLTFEIDPRSSSFTVPFSFYFGPNHYYTLKSFGEGFEKIIPLGGKVIGTISRYVIIPVFNWLRQYIASYGIIILILTILIKAVISPLTLRSYKSSAKMKVLQPEIQKINERYPKQEDAMKKQQATMDLYRKAGVSMFGGCLPVLLQFPILWAMFRFFPASFELRQQSFLWADDLSGYDSILNFGFNIPLYGDHVSLFALLMGVSMWVYSKMTLTQVNTSQMPGMKFMQLWFMPIFMVVLCNNFSAGLSYYYMLSNLITIGQNWAIRKWFVDEEKIYAALKEKSASNAAPKKSKFRQRLDEAYRIQQEQMKAQQKNKGGRK